MAMKEGEKLSSEIQKININLTKNNEVGWCTLAQSIVNKMTLEILDKAPAY